MTKDICDKIIKTVEYLAIPVATVASIWGFDISVYTTAGCGAIVGVLTFVRLFLKK